MWNCRLASVAFWPSSVAGFDVEAYIGMSLKTVTTVSLAG